VIASRKLAAVMHALSAPRFAPLRGDELRDARLGWLSTLLGRTITTSKSLSAAELKQAVDQLMREVPEEIARKYRRVDGGYTRRKRGDGKVVAMPNRSGATVRQAWKIRQLEAWLHWAPSPERLSVFLADRYHVRRPEHLQFRQAHQVIESLFAISARDRVKQREGDAHPVTNPELAAEIAGLKIALRSWQPPDPSPDPPEAA